MNQFSVLAFIQTDNLENYNAPGIGAKAMRQSFNALVSERDLQDTFLVPFRECILEGGGAAIMW